MPLEIRENVYKSLVSYRILKKKYFLKNIVHASFYLKLWKPKTSGSPWPGNIIQGAESMNCVFVNIFSLSTSCSVV